MFRFNSLVSRLVSVFMRSADLCVDFSRRFGEWGNVICSVVLLGRTLEELFIDWDVTGIRKFNVVQEKLTTDCSVEECDGEPKGF